MSSQHKYNPISFRPPEGDRVWLVEQAKEWDMPVNELLTRALREYRARWAGRAESADPGPDPEAGFERLARLAPAAAGHSGAAGGSRVFSGGAGGSPGAMGLLGL